MQVEAARVASVGDARADVELHTWLLLIPVQGHRAPDCWALWSAVAGTTPGDVCSQNKKHQCHWTVWSSFQGQDWDIQHHRKCCIPAVRLRVVLGITESLVYGAFALAASSLPAQRTGGVFQGNLKPKYPFRRLFSFLFQAGWIAVSELSIIIKVEQWSLLLTGSFSELRCAVFIIISQG